MPRGGFAAVIARGDSTLDDRSPDGAHTLEQTKRAAWGVADLERLYLSLFEGIPTAVTVRSLEDQIFIDCNQAAVRLFRAESANHLRGTHVTLLAAEIQPDGRTAREVLREIVEVSTRDGKIRLEWLARRLDGTLFLAEVHITIIALESGRRVMQTIVEDITERKAAQAALRAEEERYRSLVDRSHDAIFTFDLDGKILFASPSAERLTGYPRSELVGRSATDLIVADEHGRLEQAIVDARTGVEKVEQPWTLRHRDGSIVRIESARTAILDKNGAVIGAQSVFRDVTERQRAQQMREAAAIELGRAREEALAASRAKTAFVANMSHELRTPLNGVIGMVDLLSDTHLDARQRRYVEVARSSASLLLSVINDILDIAKIEAGKLDIDRAQLSFVDLVEEVATLMELAAEDKGLELTCETDAGLLAPLFGDPTRIRQVLVNLISNAIKFTQTGEVAVRATLVAAAGSEVRVRVEVRDTGVGISPDEQKKLFHPFSQLDSSATRKHGGAGLGLAICREIVLRMGGEIGVDSIPGRGSTFWFMLRLERADLAAPHVLQLDARLAGLRVLAVDDNATNREVLRAQLLAAGMRCELASSGEEALRLVAMAVETGDAFALLVIDQQMPEMDGVEVARRVREDPRTAGVGIVMLGSIGRPLDASLFESLGVLTWATKPIRRAHLLRALAAALDETGSAPSEGRELGGPASPSSGGRRARILLVEDTPIGAEIVTEILRRAGYAVEIAVDGLQAVDRLRADAFDSRVDGLPAPRHRWIRGHEAHPDARGAGSPARSPTGARAHSRAHRERDGRRHRAHPSRRHGRPRREAHRRAAAPERDRGACSARTSRLACNLGSSARAAAGPRACATAATSRPSRRRRASYSCSTRASATSPSGPRGWPHCACRTRRFTWAFAGQGPPRSRARSPIPHGLRCSCIRARARSTSRAIPQPAPSRSSSSTGRGGRRAK